MLFIYNMITLHKMLKSHKERKKMWDTISAFKRFVIEGISSEEVTFEECSKLKKSMLFIPILQLFFLTFTCVFISLAWNYSQGNHTNLNIQKIQLLTLAWNLVKKKGIVYPNFHGWYSKWLLVFSFPFLGSRKLHFQSLQNGGTWNQV